MSTAEGRPAQVEAAYLELLRLVPEQPVPEHVAVKVLLPHLAEDRGLVEMFLTEARIFDVGEERGQYFLAMELIPGLSLAQLRDALARRGERLSLAELVYIGRSLLEGLAHAHELCDGDRRPLELVHRDDSPQNVLVGVGGEVKVTDFGIALFRDRRGRTEPGVLRGAGPRVCRRGRGPD